MSVKTVKQKTLEQRLTAPFAEEDIEWRVQNAGIKGNNPYCLVVPYITNRAVQKRLDDIFGVMGWSNVYKPTPDGKGYLCGISVKFDDKEITKFDGAEYTNVEPLKGALSDSMKRCAVQFGIGRYLYQLESFFADCQIVDNRKNAVNCHVHWNDKRDKSKGSTLISWVNPKLPEWATLQEDYSQFYDPITEAETMQDLYDAYSVAYKAAQVNQSEELEVEATKLKDSRKKCIQANLDKYKNKLTKDLSEWLANETSIFEQLPTKTTVENFASKISDQLKQKTSTLDFDCSSLFEQLEESVKQRINKLQSKGDKNGK